MLLRLLLTGSSRVKLLLYGNRGALLLLLLLLLADLRSLNLDLLRLLADDTFLLRLLYKLNGGSTGPRCARCLELYRVLLLLLLQLRLLRALRNDRSRLALLTHGLSLIGLDRLHKLRLLTRPLNQGKALRQHGLRYVVATTDWPDDCHRLRRGLYLLGLLLLSALLRDVGNKRRNC